MCPIQNVPIAPEEEGNKDLENGSAKKLSYLWNHDILLSLHE
jgi:hypothetical protein